MNTDPSVADADDRLTDALKPVIRDIERDGFAISDTLLPAELVQALVADCLAAEAAGDLRPAAVGRGHALRDPALRGDSTLWLDAHRQHPARTGLFDFTDAIRRVLNRRLLLGLQSFEAHYALYPPGAGYVRHFDRFRDDDARVLSFVAYLNPQWPADAGGELRLHLADRVVDVVPELGRCVLFLSADVEHEVLPARLPRYSLAGWFRRRTVAGR